MPIFDGGINVWNDVFIIMYKDAAEYIKIHNKGSPSPYFESVTQFPLWNNEKPKIDVRGSFKGQRPTPENEEDETAMEMSDGETPEHKKEDQATGGSKFQNIKNVTQALGAAVK